MDELIVFLLGKLYKAQVGQSERPSKFTKGMIHAYNDILDEVYYLDGRGNREHSPERFNDLHAGNHIYYPIQDRIICGEVVEIFVSFCSCRNLAKNETNLVAISDILDFASYG